MLLCEAITCIYVAACYQSHRKKIIQITFSLLPEGQVVELLKKQCSAMLNWADYLVMHFFWVCRKVLFVFLQHRTRSILNHLQPDKNIESMFVWNPNCFQNTSRMIATPCFSVAWIYKLWIKLRKFSSLEPFLTKKKHIRETNHRNPSLANKETFAGTFLPYLSSHFTLAPIWMTVSISDRSKNGVCM